MSICISRIFLRDASMRLFSVVSGRHSAKRNLNGRFADAATPVELYAVIVVMLRFTRNDIIILYFFFLTNHTTLIPIQYIPSKIISGYETSSAFFRYSDRGIISTV